MRHVSSRIGSSTLKRSQNQWVTLLFRWRWQIKFQLSLRSTQGFVSSLLELLRLDLPVPDYSTLSRRQSSLATFLTVSPSSRPRHVVVDTTGLRVYGSGEWHVRKHRHGRRRA